MTMVRRRDRDRDRDRARPSAAAPHPPPPRPGVPADSGGELWLARATAAVPALVRRVPVTAVAVSTLLLVGLFSRTMFRSAWRMSWYHDVAFGAPALAEGKVWTLVTGFFFALTPGQYVFGLLLFALVVGIGETRLGSPRTALVCALGQIGGMLGAVLLAVGLSHTRWEWAQHVANARDVGFTTGMLAVAAVASATLHSPWRLRVRLVLGYYATLAFLFEGKLSDLAHLIVVGGGLVAGQLLYSVESGYGPRTRRETRLLAAAALVAIAAVQVVVLLFPGSGPLGSTDDPVPVLDVLVDVVVIGVLANQLRYGRRWAWWLAVALSLVNVLVAAATLVLVLSVRTPAGAPVSLGSGLLWVVVLVLLLGNSGAFRVPWHRKVVGGVPGGGDATERAKEILRDVGGTSMSWMTTWPEMALYFTEDGKGYVGYQRHAGVAIGVADPVGPPGEIPHAVAEFVGVAEHSGLTPCLFSVTEETARAAREQGWRVVQIAEDTLLDLAGLEFRGKAWQDVRSSINKARRDGVEFRLTTLAREPAAVLAQVRAISEQWVGEKGLPEMGFTLGGVEEALDPEVRVGLATDNQGLLHGVTSWLPVHGPGGVVRGWTLDVMRRRPEGFRPVMEFLIARACQEFKAEGAEFVSLSGAPLARADQAGDTEERAQIERVLDTLGEAMESLYGFRSLQAFKAKFAPRYEPVYLAFRDESDLPRIGVALTRAYLPGVSAAQLLRVGLAARR